MMLSANSAALSPTPTIRMPLRESASLAEIRIVEDVSEQLKSALLQLRNNSHNVKLPNGSVILCSA